MRTLVTLAVLLLGGCALDADYGGTRYRCDDGQGCPPGQACVGGWCGGAGAGDGAPVDAPWLEPDATAAADAGVDAGGGGPDAAAVDAAVADGGGGAPDAAAPIAACGKIGLLADDFADGVIDGARWGWSYGSGAATRAESGGRLVITYAAADPVESYTGNVSTHTFDLRDSRAFVEVPATPNPATGAQAFFMVTRGLGVDRLYFYLSGGQLRLRHRAGGVVTTHATVTYSAANHLWWQIREAGGTIFWEASTDGSTFVPLASAPAPFSVEAMRIELAAGTYAAETAPGQLAFESLNGGIATGVRCRTAALKDDFDDGVEAPGWSSSYSSGCTRAETGGELVMALASGAANDCGYLSSSTWDFAGSSVTVEVTQMLNTSSLAVAYMRVQRTDSDAVAIAQRNGWLAFEYETAGGGFTTLDEVAWSPTDHRFWRISESGGTTLWETSGDGASWQPRASTANPFAYGEVELILAAETNATVMPPGAVHFDNYNLP